MPTLARPSAISSARSRRPPRVAARPACKAALSASKPRPTMCTVTPMKVTEISTPVRYGSPSARAASRARCWPPSSSWSVSAQSSTPFAFARAASASGSSVPSETVEWQCRSAFIRCAFSRNAWRLFHSDDDHLHALDALVDVEAEPPRDADAVANRLAAAEPDRFAHDAAHAQREAQVLVADELLRDDVDGVAEERRVERGAPDLAVEQTHRLRIEVRRVERAVVDDRALVGARAERCGGDLLQRAAERVESRPLDRAARRHRVPAEAQQQSGLPLADEVERVAQMKAFDRATRSLQRAVAADCEDEGRPAQPVLETRRDDADDAFVKRRIEDREGRFERACQRKRALDLGLGVLAHSRF